MDTSINIMKDLSKIPSVCYSHMKITTTGYSVSTVWSQKYWERGVNVKYKTTHLVSKNLQWAERIGCSSHLGDVLLCHQSPSRNRKAVMCRVKQQDYLEIWALTGRKQCIDLGALDKHGKVYEDPDRFACLEWSASGNHILYIAEKYQPKRCSYFDSKLKGNQDVLQGEQYEYLEDWGETLEGKHHPVICIMDLRNESVRILENVDKDISPGQACWALDDKGIVFIGVWHHPYRMGLRFHNNRRSAVFYTDLETGKVALLSADNRHVRSVKLSPDKSKFVYLCNASYGPDWPCSQIFMYDWNSKQTILIVDQVMLPEDSCKFPGIFCTNFPDLCWADDNKRFFLTSCWRSKKEILCVNTTTKEVTRVTNDKRYGFWDILDMYDGVMLAARCSPNIPPHLVMGQIPPEGHEQDISWLSLDSNPITCEDMMWDILTFMPSQINSCKVSEELDYECILLKPSMSAKKKPPPLIVYPHGGPHYIYMPEYKIIYDFFCKLGFALLLVNYRGSLGFGQASILSLPGNIGLSDVKDIQDAVSSILHSGHADPKRVVLMGGSYGGTLCLQLIGQYPDFYKACCVRNPLCNLATRLGVSDIPDAGLSMACRLEYAPDFLPSTSHYSTLLGKSAIVQVDKVCTPVMFMVGAKDRRIPPQQSLEYHRALRARGVETKLYMYPDVHALEEVDIEGDRLLNAYKWYAKHIPV